MTSPDLVVFDEAVEVTIEERSGYIPADDEVEVGDSDLSEEDDEPDEPKEGQS